MYYIRCYYGLLLNRGRRSSSTTAKHASSVFVVWALTDNEKATTEGNAPQADACVLRFTKNAIGDNDIGIKINQVPPTSNLGWRSQSASSRHRGPLGSFTRLKCRRQDRARSAKADFCFNTPCGAFAWTFRGEKLHVIGTK